MGLSPHAWEEPLQLFPKWKQLQLSPHTWEEPKQTNLHWPWLLVGVGGHS